MSKFAVIVAAAGKSERFGGTEKKAFAKLDGRAVFLRSLELFITRPDVAKTILAVAPEDMEMVKSTFGANLSFMGIRLVQGGARRWETVAAALSAIPDEAEFVAVHDAVRPCATADMIDAVFIEATKSGAAILAVPLTGTIKRVGGSGVIEETVSRVALHEAQTPQVFRKNVIVGAYERWKARGEEATDDAQVVEAAGHPVSVVASDPTNLKITTKADMALANAILKNRPAKPTPRLGLFEEAQW
jgi:2-C-methyl-D-erythritol 4-phosphate cytidylyltransferase